MNPDPIQILGLTPTAWGAVSAGCLCLAAVAFWLLTWYRERRIILHWLHGRGCEAPIIRRAQRGRVEWPWREICYYVEYADADGARVKKLCMIPGNSRWTGKGIFWKEITPDDLLPGDWQCFECRARIPAGTEQCPKCGFH